jgi:ABC-type dipeptide/oligopeptide/nickel transport system permease component
LANSTLEIKKNGRKNKLMKRLIGMIVALVGVACLVFGIVFIVQSNSAKKMVADEISPLALSDLNAKYDTVKAAQIKQMAAEEPNIQAGKAAPSVMYDYLSAQRALLGLAKSNVLTAQSVMMNGILDIVIGIGLFLGGMVMIRKSTA